MFKSAPILLIALGCQPDPVVANSLTEVQDDDEIPVDADGDQFSDAEELAAGTDPDDCWSVPDGWANCASEAYYDRVEGEGWAVGQISHDFSFIDQAGDMLHLHRFYGATTMIQFSAMWGECPGTPMAYGDTWMPAGVQYVEYWFQDWSGDAIEHHTLDAMKVVGFPTVRSTSDESTPEALTEYAYANEMDVSGCQYVAIGPDLRILGFTADIDEVNAILAE